MYDKGSSDDEVIALQEVSKTREEAEFKIQKEKNHCETR